MQLSYEVDKEGVTLKFVQLKLSTPSTQYHWVKNPCLKYIPPIQNSAKIVSFLNWSNTVKNFKPDGAPREDK